MINLTQELADRQASYVPGPDTGCVSTYEFLEGLRVIPILGDPLDTPVTVRVHSPFTLRKSRFNYSKNLAPPYIPSPTTTRTGHTFLSGGLSIAAPASTGEGPLGFTAAGEYNFVLPKHATIDGKIMFDAWPYPSGVDMLGADNGSQGPQDQEFGGFYNTWRSQYFDLAILTSTRILG